jgi:serine/threonine protein kinase
MAPEQACSDIGPVGPATDVHALGLILFELLAGRPAYDGDSGEEVFRGLLARAVPRVRRHRPGVPRALEAVCGKCLARDPAHRFASAAELAEELRRLRDGGPPPGWFGRMTGWLRGQ